MLLVLFFGLRMFSGVDVNVCRARSFATAQNRQIARDRCVGGHRRRARVRSDVHALGRRLRAEFS